MTRIRICREDERPAVVSIINSAAEAYRGIIRADRWHEPYMSADELDREIASRVTFWGYHESNGTGIRACGPYWPGGIRDGCLHCAPRAGQFYAAVLTVCRA